MGLKQLSVSVLPTPVVVVLRRVRLRARLEAERHGRLQRRINASIVVDGLPGKPRLKGSVWGVCLAKNEEDIIGHTVQHMLEQGVAGLIVVDNCSSDSTRSILDGIADADPRLHVGTDAETGFYQGRKTSYLAHLAWRAGADWVVPFDADEFWYAPGATLAEYLGGLQCDQVWCDYRNVYPLVADGQLHLGNGHSVQVDRVASAWMRIVFRTRRWVWVGEGNHALRDSDTLPARGLHMLHFSYRSLAQYSRKVQNGVAALEAAGMDGSIATHWRLWASLTEAEQAERWSAYLSDEEGDLKDAFVRADRLVIGDPTLWRMWDPDRLFADDN